MGFGEHVANFAIPDEMAICRYQLELRRSEPPEPVERLIRGIITTNETWNYGSSILKSPNNKAKNVLETEGLSRLPQSLIGGENSRREGLWKEGMGRVHLQFFLSAIKTRRPSIR